MSLADLVRPPTDDRSRIGLAVAIEVARALGVDERGAGVLRAGTSLLIGLPGAALVVRIDAPARMADADRQVLVARALAGRGVPAVRLGGPEDQPVHTAVGGLTFWRFEELVDATVTPAQMGELARRLHGAFHGAGATAATGIPPLDPIGAARARLDAAEVAGATDRDELTLLRNIGAGLAERWPAVAERDPMGQTLVHGDLHEHNVWSTARGPILGDLEVAGMGPASYDLAPALVAVERYGYPLAWYEELAVAYGFDLRDWDGGCELMVEAYELWVTAWTVANRRLSPRHETEAHRRIRRWTHPDQPGDPWQLL